MLVSERFAQNNARSLMIVVDLRHLHLQLCLVSQHERLPLNLFIVRIDAPTNPSVPNLPRSKNSSSRPSGDRGEWIGFYCRLIGL